MESRLTSTFSTECIFQTNNLSAYQGSSHTLYLHFTASHLVGFQRHANLFIANYGHFLPPVTLTSVFPVRSQCCCAEIQLTEWNAKEQSPEPLTVPRRHCTWPGPANFRKQRFDLKFMHFLLNLSANWEKVQKRLHKWAVPVLFFSPELFPHPNDQLILMCFRCSWVYEIIRCTKVGLGKTLYISISLAYRPTSSIPGVVRNTRINAFRVCLAVLNSEWNELAFAKERVNLCLWRSNLSRGCNGKCSKNKFK